MKNGHLFQQNYGEEGIAKGIPKITAVTTDRAYEAMKLAESPDQEVDDAAKTEGTLLEERVAFLKNHVDSASIPAAKKADIRTKIAQLQGDVKFAEVFEKKGAKVTWTENSVTIVGPARDSSGRKVLQGIDVNMNKMPVVGMTLAVVALFANGPIAIRDAVEGWIILVTGLHEEAQEDDLENAFGEVEKINNLHLTLIVKLV